jgi:hypothetical protein
MDCAIDTAAPSSEVFAAFTMASTVSVVISAWMARSVALMRHRKEVSDAIACIRTPWSFGTTDLRAILYNCSMTRRGWILFIVLGLLWGMPTCWIRIAVGTIDPLVVAGSRTLIGALLLLPVALHRNALAAAFRNWKWLLAFTVIEISVSWVLLGHAETRLTSSTAGLLIAIVPLFAALIVSRLGHERLETRRLLGLGVDSPASHCWSASTSTSPTCLPCWRRLSSRCATPSGPSSSTASSRACPPSV